MKKTVIIVTIILFSILLILGVAYGIATNIEKEEPTINKLQTQIRYLNTKINENKEVYSSCIKKMEEAHQGNVNLRERRSELLQQLYNELGLEDMGLIQE